VATSTPADETDDLPCDPCRPARPRRTLFQQVAELGFAGNARREPEQEPARQAAAALTIHG
jgi:hypothetical protein